MMNLRAGSISIAALVGLGATLSIAATAGTPVSAAVPSPLPSPATTVCTGDPCILKPNPAVNGIQFVQVDPGQQIFVFISGFFFAEAVSRDQSVIRSQSSGFPYAGFLAIQPGTTTVEVLSMSDQTPCPEPPPPATPIPLPSGGVLPCVPPPVPVPGGVWQVTVVDPHPCLANPCLLQVGQGPVAVRPGQELDVAGVFGGFRATSQDNSVVLPLSNAPGQTFRFSAVGPGATTIGIVVIPGPPCPPGLPVCPAFAGGRVWHVLVGHAPSSPTPTVSPSTSPSASPGRGHHGHHHHHHHHGAHHRP